jgi:hypothetical protein
MPRIVAFLTTAALLVLAAPALAADPPLAETGAVKDVGQTQATLTAKVTPRGAATSVRFDLGTGTSYGLQSAGKDIGSGADPVTVEIPVQGLTANTTYHFRVVATSEGGTVQGADATLKTAAVPVAPTRPAATTGGVRDVATTAATLTAAVNPHGADTSYKFEWGTSSSLGKVSPTAGVGSAARSFSVTARISGLVAAKRYYYRIAASNPLGTVRGSTRSFVTASTPTGATLVARNDRVTYGSAATLTGKLAGSKVSGVRVRLQTTAFPFDSPFADTGNALRSTSSGAYSFTLPAVTRTTRALVIADGLPSIISKVVVIRSAVRAGITSVTRRADGRVVVRGRVIPATSRGVAALQRQSGAGKWLPLVRARVGGDGRYSVTLRARKRPMLVRTVGLPHDGGEHVSGTSRTVKVGARRR